MSADTPILSKIPKTAGPRLKLLHKLLESWGVTVTPNKKAKTAEAKKRLRKLPSSIQEYFESGLFAWFQKMGKRRPEWFCNYEWLPADKLQIHEETNVVPLVFNGKSEIIGVSESDLKLADPPLVAWLYLNRPEKKTSVQLGVNFTEFLIREAVVNLMMTRSQVASHAEEGRFKPEHPLLVKTREQLQPIALNSNRQGEELYFEGHGILLRERRPPGDPMHVEVEIGAKSKSHLEAFMNPPKTTVSGDGSQRESLFWEPKLSAAALTKANAGYNVANFKPKPGGISAEIRETDAGYAEVEWSVSLQFGKVKVGGRTYNCGVSADRIPWELKSWKQLDGRVVAGDRFLARPQVHFYSGQWDDVERFQFRLQRLKGKKFKVLAKFEIGTIFPDYPALIIPCEADVPFQGIHISYENFKKRKLTSKRRDELLGELFDLKDFRVKHSKDSTHLEARS